MSFIRQILSLFTITFFCCLTCGNSKSHIGGEKQNDDAYDDKNSLHAEELQPSPKNCTDVFNWYDSSGPNYSCEWYSMYVHRCFSFGDQYTNFEKTANEACCACGGGIESIATPDLRQTTIHPTLSTSTISLPTLSPTVRATLTPTQQIAVPTPSIPYGPLTIVILEPSAAPQPQTIDASPGATTISPNTLPMIVPKTFFPTSVSTWMPSPSPTSEHTLPPTITPQLSPTTSPTEAAMPTHQPTISPTLQTADASITPPTVSHTQAPTLNPSSGLTTLIPSDSQTFDATPVGLPTYVSKAQNSNNPTVNATSPHQTLQATAFSETTFSPVVSPTNINCKDSPEFWFDSGGPEFNCTWYGTPSSKGYEKCKEDGDNYENFGKTANQACCACSGGTTKVDLAAALSPSMPSPISALPTTSPSSHPTTTSPTFLSAALRKTASPTKAPTPESTPRPIPGKTSSPTILPTTVPTLGPSVSPILPPKKIIETKAPYTPLPTMQPTIDPTSQTSNDPTTQPVMPQRTLPPTIMLIAGTPAATPTVLANNLLPSMSPTFPPEMNIKTNTPATSLPTTEPSNKEIIFTITKDSSHMSTHTPTYNPSLSPTPPSLAQPNAATGIDAVSSLNDPPEERVKGLSVTQIVGTIVGIICLLLLGIVVGSKIKNKCLQNDNDFDDESFLINMVESGVSEQLASSDHWNSERDKENMLSLEEPAMSIGEKNATGVHQTNKNHGKTSFGNNPKTRSTFLPMSSYAPTVRFRSEEKVNELPRSHY